MPRGKRTLPSVGKVTDYFGERWDVAERIPTCHRFRVITGWPAARRGQPQKGPPAVILTAALARRLQAVRYEFDPYQAAAVPVGQAVLRRFRKRLGLSRSRDMEDWWGERADDLAALKGTEFAAKHGVTPACVYERKAKGRSGTHRPAWWREPEVYRLMLSDLTTAQLAERFERDKHAVHVARRLARLDAQKKGGHPVSEISEREAPGERLKAARERLGLTQTELARRLGVTRNAVFKIEHGERALLADMALAAAEAIGCRPQDLLPDLPWHTVLRRKPTPQGGEA